MLIGLGVFLTGGTGLLFLAGDREASQVARELFVLAVIVGGMFWLGYRFRVLPRRDSFRGQTEALAFTPSGGRSARPARPSVHAVPLGGVGAGDRERRHGHRTTATRS